MSESEESTGEAVKVAPSLAGQSSLTREQLYELVWEEPMLRIGERLGVSSSYMARVCTELRVPRPARGYWAQREFGKSSAGKPPLPPARPGDVTVWSPGSALPSLPAAERRPTAATRPARSGRRPTEVRHVLLAGAKAHFQKTRKTEAGLLRPYKRVLVDIVTSESRLDAILDAANALFLAFEARKHRVTLAPPDMQMRRAAFDEREAPSKNSYHHMVWAPDRITAVYVGEVPIGLTLFETTEEIEVVYVNGTYLPVADLSPAQLRRYQGPMHWTTKQSRASGRFCLQAYCPHRMVAWTKQWRVASAKELSQLASTIIQELEAAAPVLVKQVAEAEARAEAQRRQWEEKSRRRREEEERARQSKLGQESRADLLGAIDAWDRTRRVQDWLAAVERAVEDVTQEERGHILRRLEKARALVGGADALELLKRWKAPDERR